TDCVYGSSGGRNSQMAIANVIITNAIKIAMNLLDLGDLTSSDGNTVLDGWVSTITSASFIKLAPLLITVF
ncbi:MAG: hypothetical protein ACK53E_14630, partial [Pseudanabaena sp.]